MSRIFKESEFREMWNSLSETIYENSLAHGFHGTPELDNIPTKLMLIVSEIAEAMEAHRKSLSSEHIPGHTGLEEELADAVIRIMDLGYMLDLDLADAIIAKDKFNMTRPYMHGNKTY